MWLPALPAVNLDLERSGPGLGADFLVRRISGNWLHKNGNSCDNSYYQQSWSVEERVLKVIDESELEMAPHEIAQKLHAKGSTVRVILRKLLERGLILQPYPGTYCNKITYGVRFVPLCVHNVALRSFVCQDLKHDEVTEFVGGVKLHVCFGSERRKISGFIACDGGMSHDACLFAVHRWFDLAEGRLGFALSDLELTSFEVNKDYYGVRAEGVQVITRQGLFDMIERIYQKEENLVRREWKVSKPTSLTAFEVAIQKGVREHDKVQAQFELKQQMVRMAEAQKFANERLLGLEKLSEAMFKRLLPDIEGEKGGGSEYVR
jgi:DNA-binding Lrp family transcriptional regulator